MYELISKHPNQVPVGLGNSETGIDMSVMMGISELNSEFALKDRAIKETTGLKDFAEELVQDDQSDTDVVIRTLKR
jgi:hypothetical protein